MSRFVVYLNCVNMELTQNRRVTVLFGIIYTYSAVFQNEYAK